MIKPVVIAVLTAGVVTTAIYFLPVQEWEPAAIASFASSPSKKNDRQLENRTPAVIPVGTFLVPAATIYLFFWLFNKTRR